jgi:opacity protein-like surface antigen
MTRSRVGILVAALAAWLGACEPASADLTAFVGLSGGPAVRSGWGVAAGFGVVVVGFEVEYADTRESIEDVAPRTRTASGNLLVQTPVALGGVQIYGTAGGGGYHQNLGVSSETNTCVNLGGGVKVNLVGPLRVRIDYRYFRFQGQPFGPENVHRVYVGANLRF